MSFGILKTKQDESLNLIGSVPVCRQPIQYTE